MQQRNPALDAFDDFPTPMWATRACLEWLRRAGHDLSDAVVREPCANRGFMVVPLEEVCGSVVASDIFDYGVGFDVDDYLFGPLPSLVDWTFINPPFVLAAEFVHRAIGSSRQGVAVFCRSAFTEGGERYHELFSVSPPSVILQFSERVVIHRSAMRRAGDRYWDQSANEGEGRYRNAASATAYCWMLWLPGDAPALPWRSGFDWIPPSRERLERPGDYEVRGNV
jgi:hypothetical protein